MTTKGTGKTTERCLLLLLQQLQVNARCVCERLHNNAYIIARMHKKNHVFVHPRARERSYS